MNKMTPCDGTGKILIIRLEGERLEIADEDGNVAAWYEADYLRGAFLKKYRYHLVHCFADARGKGANEEFYFHTAMELYGFDFDNFVTMLQESKIKADIRIGQHSNGSPHDHGTGFRITERDLPLLFKERRILVGEN